MGFKGQMAQPQDVEVTIEEVVCPAGVFDLTFKVRPPVWSVAEKIGKAFTGGGRESLAEVISTEEVATRIIGWKGAGFRDEKGEEVPCDETNIRQAIADVPGLYDVLLLALIKGYQVAVENARKNSSPSPASTTGAERGDAHAAENTTAPSGES